MRPDQLFVAGVGSYLPGTVDVEDAIAAGSYDLDDQLSTGQLLVSVAGAGDSSPDMAVRAGRVALERSGLRPDQVCLLLHAVTSHNGLDGWNASAYLQKHVLDGGGQSYEIRQLSNGAMASIELAACYLAASPDREAVMITASDQFPEPAWDRWRSSWGLVFGDGASAAVLSRAGGFARITSMVTVTDPELEVLHRGSLPFGAAPDPSRYPIDFRARTLDASLDLDFEEAGRRIAAGMRAAVSQATEEAGLALGDIDHFVVPNFGLELLRKECVDLLKIDLDRTTWSWASRVGHLGAADQFAGLAYLSEAGRLSPGERVLMIGVGGGFNWTCVALDVLASPAWGA